MWRSQRCVPPPHDNNWSLVRSETSDWWICQPIVWWWQRTSSPQNWIVPAILCHLLQAVVLLGMRWIKINLEKSAICCQCMQNGSAKFCIFTKTLVIIGLGNKAIAVNISKVFSIFVRSSNYLAQLVLSGWKKWKLSSCAPKNSSFQILLFWPQNKNNKCVFDTI